jgi:UTP--glucose-1-phosphate uridylyltransferase
MLPGHAVLCAEHLVGNEPCGAVGRRLDGRPGRRRANPRANDRVFGKLGGSLLAVQEVPLNVKRYGIVAGDTVEMA